MAPLKRAYKGKDVDMLTACGTIIEQAIIHKATLISKRANWADPFLPDLQTRIKDAFPNFQIGIDNAEQLRESVSSPEFRANQKYNFLVIHFPVAA